MIVIITDDECAILALRVAINRPGVADALVAGGGLRVLRPPEPSLREPGARGRAAPPTSMLPAETRVLLTRVSNPEPTSRFVAAIDEAALDAGVIWAAGDPTCNALWDAGGADNLATLVCRLSEPRYGTTVARLSPDTLPVVGCFRPMPLRSAADGTQTSQPGSPTPRRVGPLVGILVDRAEVAAGSVLWIEELRSAVWDAGGRPIVVFTRTDERFGSNAGVSMLTHRGVDVIVTTLSDVPDGSDPLLGGVPVIQAITSNRPRRSWLEDPHGLDPADHERLVLRAERHHRVLSTLVAHREIVDPGLSLNPTGDTPVTALRPDHDGIELAARLAVWQGELRRRPPFGKRVLVVVPPDRFHPTPGVTRERAGGLWVLLGALRDAGYRVDDLPRSPDILHRLIGELTPAEGGTTDADPDHDLLGTLPLADHEGWLAGLDPTLRQRIHVRWGPHPPPDSVIRGVDGRPGIAIRGLRFGNVVVTIDPAAPTGPGRAAALEPSHLLAGLLLWSERFFGAAAVVQWGDGGSLAALGSKTVGPSAGCAVTAAAGDLPIVAVADRPAPTELRRLRRTLHAVTREAAASAPHFDDVIDWAIDALGGTRDAFDARTHADQTPVEGSGNSPTITIPLPTVAEGAPIQETGSIIHPTSTRGRQGHDYHEDSDHAAEGDRSATAPTAHGGSRERIVS